MDYYEQYGDNTSLIKLKPVSITKSQILEPSKSKNVFHLLVSMGSVSCGIKLPGVFGSRVAAPMQW